MLKSVGRIQYEYPISHLNTMRINEIKIFGYIKYFHKYKQYAINYI